mgnify:CR=1 FL=1
MAYIGKEPIVGNFQVCDAISVVNGQAAYTMQVSSTNVVPESVNHMLVSLNGILQKPGSSFTISGSTITFASALATGDVIDFIMLLGNVLDLGVPSDATVTDAKANFVSTSSGAGLQIKGDGTTDGTLQLNCSQNSHGIKLASPAHSAGQSYTLTFPSTAPSADKFLKTDGSGNLSFADAGGGAFTHLLTTTASNSSNITFDSSYITTTYLDYMIVFSGIKPASNGVYPILYFSTDNGSSYLSSYQDSRHARKSDGTDTHSTSSSTSSMGIIGSYSLGNITGMIFNGKITIFDPLKQSGTTDARTMFTGEIGYGTSDGYITTVNVSAMSNSSTAVNNIKFQINSGNITSGKVSLYGRKIS